MIERSGRNMTSAGHLWDNHLKGQAFVARECLVLHFGISEIQVSSPFKHALRRLTLRN